MQPLHPDDRSAIVALATATGVFKPNELSTLAGLIDWYFAEAHADDGHRAYTLKADAVLEGFVYYAPEDPTMTDRTWTLYWIAVNVARQRSGLGRRLMEFVEGDLRARNARLLLVETSSTALYEPTRQFYLRNGYEEYARLPDFYCDGDSKVIFGKRLTT
jgi:GNAT superfamily N-acetyltransferase